MGFLESVGMLAILGVVLMLIIYFIESQGHETIKPRNVMSRMNLEKQKKAELVKTDKIYEQIETIKSNLKEKYGEIPEKIEYKKLVEYSRKCLTLQVNWELAISRGNNKMSFNALQREFRNILSDPLEFWTAMDEYYKILNGKKLGEQFKREQNEFYNKYDQVIFAVFDTNRYLFEEEIILKIQSQLKIEKQNAEELFNKWETYNLLVPDFNYLEEFDKYRYEVGSFFTDELYESTFNIERENWLKKNNKKLIDN
jgi:hypothetical protein